MCVCVLRVVKYFIIPFEYAAFFLSYLHLIWLFNGNLMNGKLIAFGKKNLDFEFCEIKTKEFYKRKTLFLPLTSSLTNFTWSLSFQHSFITSTSHG